MSYSVFAFSGNTSSANTQVSFTPPVGTNWMVKRLGGGSGGTNIYTGMDGFAQSGGQIASSSGAYGEGGTIGLDGNYIVPSGHSLTIASGASSMPYSIGGVTI